MKKYIYLYLIVFTVASCQHKGEATSELPIINLDIQTEEFPDIKEVRYIPLETTDLSLIGRIDKLIYRNNQFYIFDSRNLSVFVFDSQGFLKNVIKRVGVGPGEYTSAVDIDVDEVGNIYVADNSTQRIIKYNANDMTDYEEISVKRYFLEFAISEDQSVYIGDSYDKGKLDVKLAKLNPDNRQLDFIFKNEIGENISTARYSNHYFFRSGNTLKYYKRFSPVVYSISKDGVSSSYELKSKDYPSIEVAKEWFDEKNKISKDKESYIRDISAIYEAGDYISLTVRRRMRSYALYDKKTKKTYNLGIKHEQMPKGFSGVISSDGEYFVSSCAPGDWIIQQILLNNPDMDSQTKDRLSGLTEESNPILILYKF